MCFYYYHCPFYTCCVLVERQSLCSSGGAAEPRCQGLMSLSLRHSCHRGLVPALHTDPEGRDPRSAGAKAPSRGRGTRCFTVRLQTCLIWRSLSSQDNIVLQIPVSAIFKLAIDSPIDWHVHSICLIVFIVCIFMSCRSGHHSIQDGEQQQQLPVKDQEVRHLSEKVNTNAQTFHEPQRQLSKPVTTLRWARTSMSWISQIHCVRFAGLLSQLY